MSDPLTMFLKCLVRWDGWSKKLGGLSEVQHAKQQFVEMMVAAGIPQWVP